jgi:hypothetical protein
MGFYPGGSVGPVVVVEALPLGKLLLKIDV